MAVQFIRKTAASGDTNCPALYHDPDRRMFLIQGHRVLDPATLGQLRQRTPQETVVAVPEDVLLAELATLRPATG